MRLQGVSQGLASIDTLVFPNYAEKLQESSVVMEEVAADCVDDATVMEFNPTDPWVVRRKRGYLRQKTIVGRLAALTHEIFSKVLPSTIAHAANVILLCEQHNSKSTNTPGPKLTRDRVRQILGKDAPTVRPSFGPVLLDPKRTIPDTKANARIRARFASILNKAGKSET